MTKTIHPHDIFEMAKSTGRTPSEVLDFAQREGYEITESAPNQPSQPSSTKRASVLNDPAGAVALMRQLKGETIKSLYKADPGIREGIDAQLAIEASKGKKAIQSNFNYDEQGNLFGVKESVVSGVGATVKNQTDLMKEIKKSIYSKYRVAE